MSVNGNEEIPRFGNIRKHKDLAFKQYKQAILVPELREELIDESGSHLLNLQVIRLKYNYHPYSSDMMTLMKTVNYVEDEEIFKTDFVKMLVEYLWRHTYTFYGTLMVLFSFLIILFSIYIGMNENRFGFGIAVFCLATFFFIYEILQMIFTGITMYLSDIWNLFDLSYQLFLMGTLITTWIVPEKQDDLVLQWLKALCVLFGYLKWLSFFRVFSQTRKLD